MDFNISFKHVLIKYAENGKIYKNNLCKGAYKLYIDSKRMNPSFLWRKQEVETYEIFCRHGEH